VVENQEGENIWGRFQREKDSSIFELVATGSSKNFHIVRLLIVLYIVGVSCSNSGRSSAVHLIINPTAMEFFNQYEELQHIGMDTAIRPFLIDSVYMLTSWDLQRIENDKALTKADLDTIRLQFKKQLPELWEQEQFLNQIISQVYIQEKAKPDPLYNIPDHIQLSIPIFSKNCRYCIIYNDYYCGNLCAERALKLYTKVNGKWQFVKAYYSEVS
jgi:Zn-dependent protease with chaperone function